MFQWFPESRSSIPSIHLASLQLAHDFSWVQLKQRLSLQEDRLHVKLASCVLWPALLWLCDLTLTTYLPCALSLQVRWFSVDPAVHIEREQMCCYLTRTTAATHRMIMDNLHETPTYGGWVEAKGPRYCPSIEDKVMMMVVLTLQCAY